MRAASLAIRSKSPVATFPRMALFGLGSAARTGSLPERPAPYVRRSGAVLTSSVSLRFHSFSSSMEGAHPMSPGCVIPAKRTPGMCLEDV